MVRANVRNAMGVYVGLIDEVDDGFRIVWNENLDREAGDDVPDSSSVFPDYAAACGAVLAAVSGARICETIYFRPTVSRQR